MSVSLWFLVLKQINVCVFIVLGPETDKYVLIYSFGPETDKYVLIYSFGS